MDLRPSLTKEMAHAMLVNAASHMIATYFQAENALRLLRVHRPERLIILTYPWEPRAELRGEGDGAVDPDNVRSPK